MDIINCLSCKKALNITRFRVNSDGDIYTTCGSCFNRESNERIIHNMCKRGCKVCNDPIEISIGHMIRTARMSDREYNRFNAYHFIDTDFLRGLIEDQKYCHFPDCKAFLQYIPDTYNLTTIARLNNSIGHNKDNCVLVCRSCTDKKKSNH
jgi:hypothetical protein